MNQPTTSAPGAAWVIWCDTEFPFDSQSESKLARRMPGEQSEVGTREELNDLRGIRDRVMAATLARLWFLMQERQAAWRRRQSRMPTRELEQQRSDFDVGIGAEDGANASLLAPRPQYEQQGLGRW